MQPLPPRPSLTSLIARRLREAGVDRTVIMDRPVTYAWPALPVYTDLKLLGQPLQEYLDLKVSQSIEELDSIYHGYLSTFFPHLPAKNSPRSWFCRALGVTRDAADSHFVRPSHTHNRSYGDAVAQALWFAVLVACNFKHEAAHGERKYIVTVGERRFGVDDGLPVSDYRVPGRRSRLHVTGGRLVDFPRGGKYKFPSELDSLRYWVEQQDRGDAEAFTLALNIQQQRYSGHNNLILWLRRNPTKKEIAAIFRDARRFEEFKEPLLSLCRILVPEISTKERFEQLFGKVNQPILVPLSERRIGPWVAALDLLEEEFQKGTACSPDLSQLSKVSST